MKWEQRVLHEIEKPPSVSPRSVFRESANELRWVPTLLAHGQTSSQLSPDPSQAPRLHASRGGFSVGLSPQDQSGGLRAPWTTAGARDRARLRGGLRHPGPRVVRRDVR